jgi:hypothetical protein
VQQEGCFHCPSGKYQDSEAYQICDDCTTGQWTEGKAGAASCTVIPTPYPTASPTEAPTAYPTASPTTSPTPRPYTVPVVNPLDGDWHVIEACAGASCDTYIDAGATCEDTYDGNLDDAVTASGDDSVVISRPGMYYVIYNCNNTVGTPAIPATREIKIKDSTCPTCDMKSGLAQIEASFPFTDPGAVCTDDIDGQLSGASVEAFSMTPVNVEQTGTYIITYRAVDSSNNTNNGDCKGAKEYHREVVVVDTLKPVVSLSYSGVEIGRGDSSDISSSDNNHTNPAGAYYGNLLTEAARPVSWPAAAMLAGGAGVLAIAAAVWNARPRRFAAIGV